LFLTTGMTVGLLGEASLAAHQIASNVASVAFMVPLAIGQAANVRVSYLVGAGAQKAARHADLVALVLGVVFMVCSASTDRRPARINSPPGDWLLSLQVGQPPTFP
jgi:multidrug resistance protein, MATE family